MASTTAGTSPVEPSSAEPNATELIAAALHTGAPPRKAIRPSRGIGMAAFLGVIVWLCFGLAVWAVIGHLARFSL